MEDVHGKEISLQYTTVKVPGMKPRGSKVVPGSGGSDPLSAEMHTLNIASVGTPGPPLTGRSSLGGPLQSNKDKVREIFVLSFFLLSRCSYTRRAGVDVMYGRCMVNI